jgi:putative transposase
LAVRPWKALPIGRESSTLFLRQGPKGHEEECVQDFESEARVQEDCKYQLVFIPKYRRKVLYGKLREAVGRILWELCDWQGVALVESDAAGDLIHLFLRIPPK